LVFLQDNGCSFGD